MNSPTIVAPSHHGTGWQGRPPHSPTEAQSGGGGSGGAGGVGGQSSGMPPMPRMISPMGHRPLGPASRGPHPGLLLSPADHPHPLMRPPRMPFFIREIYKNGFLKRLPYNEKKSSALSKLMRTDRYWVVFSVHDDVHPFLELWNEPTEVASKPPQYVFPLAVCKHISPSIVPADQEWSFVINFETAAIRFSCNSRDTMDEWVDCIRHKLGEMGILNPKGNLYSKVPALNPPKLARNPMSPLPSPPVSAAENISNMQATPSLEPFDNAEVLTKRGDGASRNRLSIVDASDESNQTFTTSIYLNQTPPSTPQIQSSVSHAPTSSSKPNLTLASTSPIPKFESLSCASAPSSPTKSMPISPVANPPSCSINGATSTVYLNQDVPTRHVTVIPINKDKENHPPEEMGSGSPQKQEDNTSELYTAIVVPPESREERAKARKPSGSNNNNQQQREGRRRSPNRRQRHLEQSNGESTNEGQVSRRFSDRRPDVVSGKGGYNIQQRIRRKTQRSSSLGPLLDEHNIHSQSLAQQRNVNTNSLESIDSNPRSALPKSDRSKGAIPRRPLTHHTSVPLESATAQDPPPRHLNELPAGIRPPPYHPLSNLGAHPPHIPLPGLTCQLSLPHGMAVPGQVGDSHPPQRSLREQQVHRLRQEIAHPSGVRLALRKRDCQHSLALVEFFGRLWVAGWKQKEYPVLYNAFHIGDQIMTVAGLPVRTASEFSKLVKTKGSNDTLHVEIIIRRLPFAQVFHLRREIDTQPLGIITHGNTNEIKEILPGGPASNHGMTSKVRSFDGLNLVPWVLTEVNGRPLNLFAKEGEATDRLHALGRDVSVTIQPADIVQRFKKQLKSFRSHKDYVLG
ncbi:hypothetical protein TCAL_02681 [Tigriopus californicus]|uniref:PH domain-containing protein n=1 Tax=Tigriopus californicus TaxID=6832 RepID=A0A553PH03_TIGCA|nr:uncharacterized protein LOC131880841 [Tigriopus californicus]TRY76968.1 hypothetical protein TCAL_02681 [Tigriopus californicus]